MQNVGLGKMMTIGAGYMVNVGAVMSVNVGLNRYDNVGFTHSATVGKDFSLKVGAGGESAPTSGAENVVAPAAGESGGGGGGGSSIEMDKEKIVLKVGKSTLTMKADGTIQLDGKDISLIASNKVLIDGTEGVQLKGGPNLVCTAKEIDLN